MPAVISHYLLADRLIPDVSRMYPALHRKAFLWGAAGPDIFFAHRVLSLSRQRSLSKISHIMHRSEPGDVLTQMMTAARGFECPISVSYVLGFATHFAFDSIAHPYIVGYADKKAAGEIFRLPFVEKMHEQIENGIHLSSVHHNHIEGCLDTILLMREKHLPVRLFRLEKTCPRDEECMDAIPELMGEFIRSSGICADVTADEVRRAMKDWRFCLRAVNDRLTAKRAAIRRTEKLLHLPPLVSVLFHTTDMDYENDYANLSHSEWISSYDGSVHNESFLELFDFAEERSLSLIRGLLRDCYVPAFPVPSGYRIHNPEG